MTTQNLSLLQGLTTKMSYLNHRQSVISQNVANADTPNYTPKDVVAPDFGQVLDTVDKSKRSSIRMSVAATSAGHIRPGSGGNADFKEAQSTYEVAPAGNAVIIEEQLINAQRTMMDYNLMTSLYQKNVGMLKMSIGGR